MIKASTTWFENNRDDAKKKEVYAMLLAAKPALDKLKEIVEKKRELSRNTRLTQDDYSKPSWAYLQADAIGEERAYSYILKLLEVKIEESK